MGLPCSNAWRSYPRAPLAAAGDPVDKGARRLSAQLRQRSHEWQREQIKRTGFVQNSELGHSVYFALRRRGYPRIVALVGAHLAAVGTPYNWQGCARIAQIIGCSKRTVQRARAWLESDGLITSHLLLTGDRIEGQRAAVWHPQVIRFVARLQRFGAPRMRAPERRRRKASAAEVSHTDETTHEEPVSNAVMIAYAAELAAADKRERKPPRDAAPVVPSEIDTWDAETNELERARPAAPERGPPDR